MRTNNRSLIVLITDWIFVATLGVLVFSGFYLHNPFFFGKIGGARYAHLVVNYLILTILAIKIYFRLLGLKSGAKPNFVKRVMYSFWFFILPFQALVTFSAYLAPTSYSAASSFFGGLSGMLLLHYFLMWILAGSIAIYIYVSVLEAAAGIYFENLGDFFEKAYRKRKA